MLLISGLSGAGKSTVLHALEDAEFFCTDNLPLEMLRNWSLQMQLRKQSAAVCLDVRSGMNAEELHEAIETVLVTDDWQLIFIEAEDAVLQRRFSTLRRRHPFPGGDDLMQSIRQERESMQPIRDMADLVLDSSHLTPYELGEKVDYFRLNPEQQQRAIACTIMSFSYRQGLPQHADMVLDMRMLPNPHYQPNLASQTGRDADVISFLKNYDEVAEVEHQIQQWLLFVWPLMIKERKQYFTLAVGCSGGRHRSVYMAERLALWMQRQDLVNPTIQHRELGIVYRWPPEDDHTGGGS
jgi:UPF0042 nucleotide-binding protein